MGEKEGGVAETELALLLASIVVPCESLKVLAIWKKMSFAEQKTKKFAM